MNQPFSGCILRPFREILISELGQENLSLLLEKAGLPSAWANVNQETSNDDQTAAEMYAGLQKALRTYYGRGVRGILQRSGSFLWRRLLEGAPLNLRIHAAVMRKLPLPNRPKAALQLLASLLNPHPGNVTVHTLDLDLLLSDHASPGAPPGSASEPICFVTLGLLHECLF